MVNIYMKKKNKNIINKLPLAVRILGAHFDPKLTMQEHVRIMVDRCNKDIYKLIEITHCKYFKLKANYSNTMYN